MLECFFCRTEITLEASGTTAGTTAGTTEDGHLVCQDAVACDGRLPRVRTYDAGEPHDDVARTKTGRVLTEADLLALAEEAERGYDCAVCGRITADLDEQRRCRDCRPASQDSQDQDSQDHEAAYLRGRADERASVIGWLRAESDDEAKADLLRGRLSTWGAALDWASRALSNIAASSEVQDLAVRRMKLPEDL